MDGHRAHRDETNAGARCTHGVWRSLGAKTRSSQRHTELLSFWIQNGIMFYCYELDWSFAGCSWNEMSNSHTNTHTRSPSIIFNSWRLGKVGENKTCGNFPFRHFSIFNFQSSVLPVRFPLASFLPFGSPIFESNEKFSTRFEGKPFHFAPVCSSGVHEFTANLLHLQREFSASPSTRSGAGK